MAHILTVQLSQVLLQLQIIFQVRLVLDWLIVKEDGGEILIAAMNWSDVPPELCRQCRVWIDLVEYLRESNNRLSRSFLFLRLPLRDLIWLVQSDAT